MTASVESIEAALRAALPIDSLSVIDESHLHVGHAGARGGGHYRLCLQSLSFAGLSRIARHRLVYDALAPLMQHEIHALTIEARAPGES